MSLPFRDTRRPESVYTCANAQRVLVTGGLGYIGSHVVVALLLTGRYLPVVVDNCHNAYPEAIRQCAEIARDVLG
jgi:UDP-glucose 4-epimerase